MSPSSIFMLAVNALCFVFFLAQFSETEAWISSSATRTSVGRILGGPQLQNRRCSRPSSSSSASTASRSVLLFESIAADSSGVSFGSTADDDDDDDDDDEWEEVEMEILTESDFYGSEWLVGSVMERNTNKIVETWVRLATDSDGKNVAIWGDNAQGTWSFDVANQFLSFSKQNIFGKAIWAGVVDDYYYTLGTIRGYNMWSAAAVLGQWQAKRLGVEQGEAGVAPWFEEPEPEQEVESVSDSASSPAMDPVLSESQEQTSDESSSSII
mmetsp:Transcript_41186/g.98648  ORF Transcript_41186/g.98648 Transcript_41186/m.98648 type:complete len:269 (-) Transcript_41186:111-917(-)|eukprot:CAMPEP_0113451754 /NCGR_PEP_ID=MMETSP0014_2-20120614/6499_1 /TAXON_ID=2857 /ORGANISM="Nitzschia sp." /LENGTH=268 /DNA_ID=CAMNT_0000343115 /DNA_START=64 /DNA_END=870 /DNA_ORIENTATION=+ /assembly_acc=CAM_ASM_000159